MSGLYSFYKQGFYKQGFYKQPCFYKQHSFSAPDSGVAGEERAPDTELPVLVFLHGLLGDTHDWQAVSERLGDFPQLLIDLPGHGQSRDCESRDMDECCEQITQLLNSRFSPQQPLILIGYSLGGRIAMYGFIKGWWAELNLKGLIIEGGNFGLPDEAARQQRWLNDQRWAGRFRDEPIEQVLRDWYRQPVFSSLNDEQRQQLIVRRRDNLGTRIARMMLATSLARQPDLLAEPVRQPLPFTYICGERDDKFRKLAAQTGLSVYIIRQAGHNVHQEQPDGFVRAVRKSIDTFCNPDKLR